MSATASSAAKQAHISLTSKAKGVSPTTGMSSIVNNAFHAHPSITSVTQERMDMPPKTKPNMTLGLARLN
jgi:hypothetical protein